jgi:mono/diheme cytochrome c family protein
MARQVRFAVASGAVVAVMAALGWQALAGEAPKAAGDPALVKRGAYLVLEVARCGDCHTPHNAKGEPDVAHLLEGGKLPFTPTTKPEGWNDHAPDLTASGLASKWSEAKLTKFLSTGGRADPPMPAYKLAEEDARAIAVYLRSLPGHPRAAGGRKD